MIDRSLMGALALAAVLGFMCGAAQAGDEAKFPDWSGQWLRTYGGNPRYDQTKPIRKQEAPLKPEYQVRYEASLKDQDEGGHGLDRGYSCLPQGMPRMMSGVSPFEFLFAPNITHILFERTEFSPRRIYTDGRDWPKTEQTWFTGYSIGKWLDTDGDGRYDTLEIETRRVRAPRVWDQSGIPMADDPDGIIKERMYLDPRDAEQAPGRDDHDRQLADAAMDGAQDLQAPDRGLVERGRLRRGPGPRHHRRPSLLQERRRHHHADEEGPAAAGFEIFQAAVGLTADLQILGHAC